MPSPQCAQFSLGFVFRLPVATLLRRLPLRLRDASAGGDGLQLAAHVVGCHRRNASAARDSSTATITMGRVVHLVSR